MTQRQEKLIENYVRKQVRKSLREQYDSKVIKEFLIPVDRTVSSSGKVEVVVFENELIEINVVYKDNQAGSVNLTEYQLKNIISKLG